MNKCFKLKLYHYITLNYTPLLQADLQTSSQRLTLSGANAQPVAELAPTRSIDDVVHHEVKELGTHMLVNLSKFTNLTNLTFLTLFVYETDF